MGCGVRYLMSRPHVFPCEMALVSGFWYSSRSCSSNKDLWRAFRALWPVKHRQKVYNKCSQPKFHITGLKRSIRYWSILPRDVTKEKNILIIKIYSDSTKFARNLEMVVDEGEKSRIRIPGAKRSDTVCIGKEQKWRVTFKTRRQ